MGSSGGWRSRVVRRVRVVLKICSFAYCSFILIVTVYTQTQIHCDLNCKFSPLQLRECRLRLLNPREKSGLDIVGM